MLILIKEDFFFW